MKYSDLFKDFYDRMKQERLALRRLLTRHGPLQAPTKKPGSKRLPYLVKAERRYKNKAARQARKLNRRGKSRPKGRRTK